MNGPAPIRVLVADDSLSVRRHLVEILEADGAFVVVGEAADGRQAVDRCLELRPDVVTLDMAMPVMDGLAATEYLMAYCPTPILIVSGAENRSEALSTLSALAAGALDTLDKPGPGAVIAGWERQFRQSVRIVSRVKVITHPRAKLAGGRPAAAAPTLAAPPGPAPFPGSAAGCELVAIGASTGGPQALLEILPALPADFGLPIVIVLHYDARFDSSLCEWLSGLTPLPVWFAEAGTPVPPPGQGQVLLARSGRHLIVETGRLAYHDGPPRHSCRPSVDILFESLAASALAPRTAACILTGMGSDGADGLVALRRAGARTFAQDEATSAIFGMPGEAIRRGGAQTVLPLDRFAAALTGLQSGARRAVPDPRKP